MSLISSSLSIASSSSLIDSIHHDDIIDEDEQHPHSAVESSIVSAFAASQLAEETQIRESYESPEQSTLADSINMIDTIDETDIPESESVSDAPLSIESSQQLFQQQDDAEQHQPPASDVVSDELNDFSDDFEQIDSVHDSLCLLASGELRSSALLQRRVDITDDIDLSTIQIAHQTSQIADQSSILTFEKDFLDSRDSALPSSSPAQTPAKPAAATAAVAQREESDSSNITFESDFTNITAEEQNYVVSVHDSSVESVSLSSAGGSGSGAAASPSQPSSQPTEEEIAQQKAKEQQERFIAEKIASLRARIDAQFSLPPKPAAAPETQHRQQHEDYSHLIHAIRKRQVLQQHQSRIVTSELCDDKLSSVLDGLRRQNLRLRVELQRLAAASEQHQETTMLTPEERKEIQLQSTIRHATKRLRNENLKAQISEMQQRPQQQQQQQQRRTSLPVEEAVHQQHHEEAHHVTMDRSQAIHRIIETRRLLDKFSFEFGAKHDKAGSG